MELICPVCKLVLQRERASLVCAAGHAYDIAKEGYVNLLLANQKRTASPGDSKEMVRARRAFHDRDHYLPLAQAVEALIEERLVESVVDLGCGDGYYGARLGSVDYCGIDISKEAVKIAARRLRGPCAVASTSAVPLADQSVDAALSIFAPTRVAETRRVARRFWVNVVPAEKHLLQLRQLLYRDVHDIEKPPPLGMTPADSVAVCFDFVVDKKSLRDLVQMTPYAWQADRARLQLVEDLPSLTVTADFRIDCYDLREIRVS